MNDTMISGKWLNKNTGEIIVVNNSIIDGDQMILITSNGQMSMNEFTNNYIQVSDEIYNENGQVIKQEPIENDEYSQMIQELNVNQEINNSKSSILDKPVSKNKSNQQSTSENQTKKNILKKFFEKAVSDGQVLSFNINLENCNLNELKIIMEYTGITNTDISEYILNEFFDKETFIGIINAQLNSYLINT